MKKLICALLALALLAPAPPARAEFDDSDVQTRHVLLMEAESKAILYEKAAHEHAFPASTTKIMTCILALENGNLDDVVTVPSVTDRGSRMHIRKGETMSLRSLLYGVMLVSGNDAAEAVAVHVGGTKADFVAMMNKKAKEIGMSNTNFVEPSGLHKEEHVTTAYDMALLTRYALLESPQKDNFRAIVKKDVYNVTDSSRTTYELENSNRLLHTPSASKDQTNYKYRYAIGVKTGDTDFAMRCLVAAAEKDGVTLISVQLYDTDTYARFPLAAKLFDYGFANFASASATSLGLPDSVQVQVKNYSLENGEELEGGLLTLNVSLSGKTVAMDKASLEEIKANAAAVEAKVITNGEVIAPIQAGDVVATVAYSYNGAVLFTADAIASRSVAELGSVQNGATPLPDLNPQKTQGEAGPWLFIILVLVVILFAAGLVMYLRSRNKRRRRVRRRGTYTYRNGGRRR